MNASEVRDLVRALGARGAGAQHTAEAAREQVRRIPPEHLGNIVAEMLGSSRSPSLAERWTEDVRYAEIFALLGEQHRNAVIDSMLPILDSPSPSLWVAIGVLGELRATEARAPLHALAAGFDALDQTEQIELASALGDLGGPDEARVLERLGALDGLDDEVRYEIADALARCERRGVR